MRYPEFYERVPLIRLFDPLGEFLGAFEDGIVDISYLDCVKLAGHSCPTVAGAFLMTYRGLQALYGSGETLPSRSEIMVEIREEKHENVSGVTGYVSAYICGAGDEGGFPGIGGSFGRRGKLLYGVKEIKGEMRLSRIDTSASVTLKLDMHPVGGSPEIKSLMQKALLPGASEDDKRRFRELWQERVETMLTNPELWDRIAVITEQSS